MLKITLNDMLEIAYFSFATESKNSMSISEKSIKEDKAQDLYHGVLQACWLTVWSDDGKNTDTEKILYFSFSMKVKENGI